MSAPTRKENLLALQDTVACHLGSPDPNLGVHPTIDITHNEVHKGNFYTYSLCGTIGAGTINAILLTIKPAIGTTLHMQGIVTAKNSGWVELREDCTVIGGTIVTPKNNNRVADNTMAGTITLGGVVQTFGVFLQARAVGSASPGVRIGAESVTRNEWILDEDYTYLLWFYADNASTQVSMDFEAYEVTT